MIQDNTVIVVVRGRDEDIWFDTNSDPHGSQYVVEACRRDPSLEKFFFHYPDHLTFAQLKGPLGLG